MTNIMVVDDEPEIFAAMRLALEKEGLEVVEARDGYECLDKLCYEKPDLILLDVMMPGVDGGRTCKLIKENDRLRSIPVCMLTVLSKLSSHLHILKLRICKKLFVSSLKNKNFSS